MRRAKSIDVVKKIAKNLQRKIFAISHKLSNEGGAMFAWAGVVLVISKSTPQPWIAYFMLPPIIVMFVGVVVRVTFTSIPGKSQDRNALRPLPRISRMVFFILVPLALYCREPVWLSFMLLAVKILVEF